MAVVQNKAAIYDELQLIANYFLSQGIVASFLRRTFLNGFIFKQTHVWYSYSFT